MLQTSQSVIQQVAIHHVGNKTREESLHLTNELIQVEDDNLMEIMKEYFLSHFQAHEFFTFTGQDGDFELNPLYKWATEIFRDQQNLLEVSRELSEYLYAVTQHPNIKAGELCVAYIGNIMVEGVVTDAIGIFKAETKETFIKLKHKKTRFEVSSDEGINIKKLDKGCLILNWESEAGYKLLIVDQANSVEAQYWRDDFLAVKPWSDAYHHTQNFLTLTQEYLSDQMQEEFKISRTDQIDLLNRSVDFFKKHEQFDQREFETEVLGDANVIESFRKFGDEFRSERSVDLIDHFEISAPAVKRQARIFKSVLKLDKNFHVYIHGNTELIERGYDDEVGKNFYKIYFDRES